MGVLDALGKGLGKLGDGSERLISNALWRGVKGRAGDVLDSRRGTVQWVADDGEHAFDIVSPALPPTRVALRLREVRADIGGQDVELVVGKRAVRRATFSARAELDGHRYVLSQTGRRRARFERDAAPLATLARPRRSARVVDWGSSSVSDPEIALAHALAVYAGIGAPGAIANTLGNISP